MNPTRLAVGAALTVALMSGFVGSYCGLNAAWARPLGIDPPDDATTSTTITSSDGKVSSSITIVRNGKTMHWDSRQPGVKATLKQSIACGSARRADVASDFGDIAFSRSPDPNRISVECDITVAADKATLASQRAFLSKFKVGLELQGENVRIRAVPPAEFPRNMAYMATFRVSVPAGFSLSGSTSNGSIAASGIGPGGRMRLRSDYGSVTVRDSGSSIDAGTSNGAVTVRTSESMAKVNARSDYGAVTVDGPIQSVDASSSNGAVTVRDSPNAQSVTARSDYGSVQVSNCGGAIHASSSNGAVAYREEGAHPSSVSCRSDYGNVSGSLTDCGSLASAELSTSNGSVNLGVFHRASIRIDAHTSNGSITKSGVGGQVRGGDFDKSFEADMNGGKTPVRLSSDFGSISIAAG